MSKPCAKSLYLCAIALILALSGTLLAWDTIWAAAVNLEAGFLALRFGQLDALQYWSAARAWWHGGNPYDPQTLATLQTYALRGMESDLGLAPVDWGVPVLMWNPPLVLPVFLPFQFLDFGWFVLALFLLSICTFIYSQQALFLEMATTQVQRPRFLCATFCFSFTFYPVALALYYGQLSLPILAGLTIFIVKSRHIILRHTAPTGSYTVLCGMGLMLTLFKPHLLYLVYLLFLCNFQKTAVRRIACSALCWILALSTISLAISPGVLSDYFNAHNLPPTYWQTPTLGSLVQGAFLGESFYLRIAPTLLTGSLLGLWYWKKAVSLTSEHVFWVIPLSLFTSPYGWTYDHVLVLPTVLWVLAVAAQQKLPLFILGLVLCIAPNIMFVLPGSPAAMQHYWWFPLYWTILSAFVYRLGGRVRLLQDATVSVAEQENIFQHAH